MLGSIGLEVALRGPLYAGRVEPGGQRGGVGLRGAFPVSHRLGP